VLRKVFLLAAVLVGCHKADEPRGHPPVTTGPLVATFGGHSLTTAELQRHFDEQSPYVRSHFQSPEAERGVVLEMIRTRLLVDQALKGDFDKDDEAEEQFEKAMIAEWMKAKFNDAAGMKSLSTADLRAYYDAHLERYQQPERFRLQMIFFKVDPGNEDKIRREAEAARKSLSQRKYDSAFDNFALLRSDDSVTKIHGGDLGFQSHEELEKSLGKAVANEAFRLVAPNDLSTIVPGADGLYLLKLEARKPAFNQTFEQSEKAVRYLVWTERRNQVFDAFMKKMLADADIKIDDSELAKIRFDHPDTATDRPPQPAAGDEDAPKAF